MFFVHSGTYHTQSFSPGTRTHTQVSIPNEDEEIPKLYTVIYNSKLQKWQKHSDFTVNAESVRNKRQGRPIVLENPNTPISVFMAVAGSQGINCWFQGRTFDEDVQPATDMFITIEQVLSRSGSELLVRFGLNTAPGRADGTTENAVCLPVDCGAPISASISAREGFDLASVPLAPLAFPGGTFPMDEDAPIFFGDIFSFQEVVASTVSQPRPFYTSLTDCIQSAVTLDPPPAAFFGFRQDALPAVVSGDSCYVKVQILDCFFDNIVTVISINPDTGAVDLRSDDPVFEPMNIEMPTDFSGTYPPDVTTMAVGGVCDETTATLRAACIQHVCGDNVIVMVRPNPDSGQQMQFCQLTGTSVLLGNNFLSDRSDPNQIVLRLNSLRSVDYNTPDIGLYFEPGNNLNAATVAEEMCNAGTGGGAVATEIDVTTGPAVEFSCFV